MSGQKRRNYVVVETYEAVGQFEVEATSKREALAKVSDHLTTMGGHPDVHPRGGVEGHMTGTDSLHRSWIPEDARELGMITPAPASAETFGLPAEASHLIAKLRNMPPELLATIITKDTK